MRKWLILLILIATPALSDVTLYKWTDDGGVVHYSDTPQPNQQTEIIVVRSAQGYQPSPLYTASTSAGGQSGDGSGAATSSYTYIRIEAPTPDQVLWNIGGTLDVTLALSPPIENGHSIALYYDSNNVASAGSRRLNFVLNDVTRGQHSLRAAVIDGSGQDITTSDVTMFQVHQTSVQ